VFGFSRAQTEKPLIRRATAQTENVSMPLSNWMIWLFCVMISTLWPNVEGASEDIGGADSFVADRMSRARRLYSVLEEEAFDEWVDSLSNDDVDYFYDLLDHGQVDRIMDAFRFDTEFDDFGVFDHDNQYHGDYYHADDSMMGLADPVYDAVHGVFHLRRLGGYSFNSVTFDPNLCDRFDAAALRAGHIYTGIILYAVPPTGYLAGEISSREVVPGSVVIKDTVNLNLRYLAVGLHRALVDTVFHGLHDPSGPLSNSKFWRAGGFGISQEVPLPQIHAIKDDQNGYYISFNSNSFNKENPDVMASEGSAYSGFYDGSAVMSAEEQSLVMAVVDRWLQWSTSTDHKLKVPLTDLNIQ